MLHGTMAIAIAMTMAMAGDETSITRSVSGIYAQPFVVVYVAAAARIYPCRRGVELHASRRNSKYVVVQVR